MASKDDGAHMMWKTPGTDYAGVDGGVLQKNTCGRVLFSIHGVTATVVAYVSLVAIAVT